MVLPSRLVLASLLIVGSDSARRGIKKAAQDGYTTVNGCKCRANSQCQADVGTRWRCDTCNTEGRCGTWSVAGRWDYCDYRPQTRSSFIGQSWNEKMDYFWKKVVANTIRFPTYPLLSNLLSSVTTTFDNFRSEMPTGREKMIHTVGSVCQFTMDIPRNSPYTGMFGSGQQSGLIRLGGALDPEDGITPGLGLKFPRSGRPDGDFVALHSLAAGTQWNFFAKNQSTHVEPLMTFPINILVNKFREATDCVYMIGLSDLARYSQDGTEHASPKFPFKLFFVGNPDVKTGQGELSIDGIHKEIDAIRPGTKLYDLYACGEPAGDEMDPASDLNACGAPFKLGEITTSTQCTTSWYGDASLHFRHTRIEEDWELEPSFKHPGGQFDINKKCGQNVDGVPPPRCGEEGMLNSDA